MTPQTQHALARDYAAGAFDGGVAPCLSLYQPTHRHHPENKQDVIRFGNLVKSLEQSLLQAHPAADTRALLEPLRALANDAAFWNGCNRQPAPCQTPYAAMARNSAWGYRRLVSASIRYC